MIHFKILIKNKLDPEDRATLRVTVAVLPQSGDSSIIKGYQKGISIYTNRN